MTKGKAKSSAPLQDNLESRTGEKLEYARQLFEQLRRLPRWDPNDPLVRALEESVLYHVIGARDAFLQEINGAYALGLGMDKVSVETLKTGLNGRSRAFDEIARLSRRYPKKRWSWLAMALEIRDHGTHRGRPPRVYFEGGPNHGTVRYISPRYRRKITQSIPDMLADAIAKMDALIQRLRRTLPW